MSELKKDSMDEILAEPAQKSQPDTDASESSLSPQDKIPPAPGKQSEEQPAAPTASTVSIPAEYLHYDEDTKQLTITISLPTVDTVDSAQARQAARFSSYKKAIAQLDSMNLEKKAEAAVTLTPDSTYGDKIRALRTAQGMTINTLAKETGLTARALRYMESNERVPSVEALSKICDALGVRIDYFMDQTTYQAELSYEQFFAEVKARYGSRSVAQAKKIREETYALFAGGELSEADKMAFIEEMQEIFFDAKDEAKKYTPKKYRKEPAGSDNQNNPDSQDSSGELS